MQPEYTFYLAIGPCNVRLKSEIFSKFILMTVYIGPCKLSTLYIVQLVHATVRPKVKYFQNLYS